MNDATFSEKHPSADIFVEIPPYHQGVADALRNAFAPERHSIPEDLAELLTRLG